MESASQEAVEWIQAIFMIGSLVMIGVVLSKAKSFGSDLDAIWKKLGKMHELTGEVAFELSKVKADVNTRPAGLFTVLVVGHNTDGSIFTWGTSDIIAWHEEKQVSIPLQATLKKGAAIICTGEAELREVLCGHISQTPWMNGGSPLCFTQDDTHLGVHIIVRVRSNRA